MCQYVKTESLMCRFTVCGELFGGGKIYILDFHIVASYIHGCNTIVNTWLIVDNIVCPLELQNDNRIVRVNSVHFKDSS